MGTLFFAQLSSLPQYLHEQQSSAPRLGANFNKNAKANINRKDSLVSSGKASVRKKISRRPHPLSGLSASEISPLSNVSSGLKPQADATLEKKSAFAKAARKLRKGGRKHVSRPPAQDYKSELPSWQGLSRLRIECTDFPENQFKGFSNSKPDNHRGFSIIEQQRMISGKFDDSEGGSTGGQRSNRERRSHHSSLGWETHTVFAIAGGCVPIGLRIFHCSHSRNVNSKVDLEFFGGNDSGQKYGSGGDSGGRGRGGGGGGGGGGGDGGGDRLGPGDFSANCEGSLTDYEVVKEGTEEEQCSAVVASDMQEKHDGIDLSSNVEAQSNGKLLFFASLSLIAGDSEPKGKFGETGDAMSSIEGSKHSEDIHKAGEKSHVREKDVKGDPKQESPSCLPKGNMQRTFINLGERLVASAKAFCFDFIKSPLFDVSNAGGGSLELLPVHSDQGAHFSHQADLNLNDDPLLSSVQDLDDAFQRESSTESWVTEQMANQRPSKSIDTSQSELNNIEQVVGLLSRVGQPALPERTRSLSQTTERYFTSNTASDAFDSCGYIEASSLKEGKQTASLQVAPLVPFLDRKLQPEQSDCPSECFAAATQSHGWSEDGLCWLTGLVHSVLTKRTGGQEKSCNEGGEALERKALVDEIVSLTVNQLLETDGAAAVAKRSEIEALRRLQREVFSDLLKIRERLDKIEQLIGLRRPSDLGNLSGVARTQLKGEVKAGFALMMLEDSNSRHARSSLEQAGMQTGLDVRFTFETPFRERDLLITQCIAGQGSSVGDGRALGGPISLGKVLYSAHINDDFSISVVPLGAQGKDVTEIVNPLQDQALTEFNSNGPVLFSHCKGSAVGATVSGSNFALSVAQYLSGWGNQISALGSSDAGSDPLCLSTLGQFLFQPSERMLFSLSGLNRYWPSPPLPTSMGLHWSEMGPLIIPKIQSQRTSRSTVTSQVSTSTSVSHGNNLGSPWDDPGIDCSDGILDNKGTSMQSIAVATEMELGEHVSIGGWAQVERGDWLQDSDSANLQWALSLARNSGRSVDWGVSIGGSKPDIWSMATSDQEGYPGYSGGDVGEVYGPQMHLEAFLKINCARGFTLQPGLLYVLNKYSHTPALMLRSSWTM